jgi:hypothetical protein
MAISWLETGGLWPLLDGGTRIVVANGTETDSLLEIVGAVVALHDEDGGRPEVRRTNGLSIAAGESFAFTDDRPGSAPIAAEAILRIVAPEAGVTAEVYVRSDENRTAPIDSIEVGVAATDDAPAGAAAVPEIEGLSVYIKLEP